MIPDVYAKLTSDDKKMSAAAGATSHFLACIESRATDSMDAHCYSISANRSRGELLRMNLQFGGAAIPMRPFPGDFKSHSDRAIKAKSGFDVTLVEKAHLFYRKS